MKTTRALFYLWLLCLSSNAQSQPASPRREIMKLEEQERTAEMNGDTATLFGLWSTDFVVNNPNGMILTAVQLKAFIRKGGIAKNIFTRDIEKITLGKDIAIVMGAETLAAKDNKDPSGKEITRRFTNTWIKTDKGWQLAARQASNIIMP